MKIKYIYEEPDESYSVSFDSLKAFLEDKKGKMFKQLLSKERAEVTDKIIIYTDYPSTITIEIKEKKKGV